MRCLNFLLIISVILVDLYVTFINCHVPREINTENVETPLGKIKGSTIMSRLNKTIYSFRGIRYAEPPVGKLRFQPPQPVKSWENIFDASEEGPSCPRPGNKFSSEDCLRLNVYTTKLPNNQDIELKPVIVFFHPGGFYGYSGQSFNFGPKYLLDKDIVLVTVNYRLASLGFLSTGDELIPGNMGLKDQVLSLKWVHNNIQYFGGDPNRVTISGYSAGSWSCILHMVSPMSQGLFHRVIAMSSAPKAQLSTPRHQRHLVVKQAKLLNCPNANLTEAVECMRTKPAQDIANTLKHFYEFYGNPILIWRPVIEPEIPGIERFLTDHPENLIQDGKFAKVPVIAGVNENEFGGVIVNALSQAARGNFSIFEAYNKDWYRVAPISFLYERDTNKSFYVSDQIKKFYLNDQDYSLSNIYGMSHLYCDSITVFSMNRFVNLISAHNSCSVYFYNFAYQGRYSFVYYVNTTTPFGAVHHDELIYLFSMQMFPLYKTRDPEFLTVRRMTYIFENFAKAGTPIPENDDLFNKTSWIRYTNLNKAYLEINEHITMKNNLKSERMAFWDSLFPIERLT